jgi:hypothetical protein
MNGGNKSGVSAISLEKLQCAKRNSASPTVRRRRVHRMSTQLQLNTYIKSYIIIEENFRLEYQLQGKRMERERARDRDAWRHIVMEAKAHPGL